MLAFSVTAAGVAIAWLLTEPHRAQQRAVAAIAELSGHVEFERTGPDWLRTIVGEEYLRKVTVVDLAITHGRATDADLIHLESLPNVETLELGNSFGKSYGFTDAGLVHLKELRKLKTLYLHRTSVRGPGLVHLLKLPQLTAISLAHSDLDDEGLKHIGNTPGLTWLSLDNTKVTDAGMPDLAQATALETLTMSNVAITDAGLSHLRRLRRLKTLNVTGTLVTLDGVTRIRQALPNCQVSVTYGLGQLASDDLLFPIGYRPTAQEINERFKQLNIAGEVETDPSKPGTPIVKLRLFGSPFSDRVVLSLVEQMPELEQLNLRGALVGDDFLKGIRGMLIRYLSLQATRVTDDGLRHAADLSALRELVLVETEITDDGLHHLESLSGLTSVLLANTRVTIDGVTQLKKALPNCNVGQ
jgi:hypothetical protein